MIVDDAARLDRLVVRLLELARVEADDTAPEELDLLEAARAAAAPVRAVPVQLGSCGRLEAWRPHRGRLARARLAGSRAALRARVRPAALAAALANLLDNAAHHAAAHTAVTLTVGRTGDRIRLAVHNRGTPISPAVQARVWDRFFTTRADQGGSGLGLAIVRAVATAHGGTVGLTSTATDGTTFWIELPSA